MGCLPICFGGNEMDRIIEETIRLNNLFDIYKGLLTEKQKAYFSYYYRDDYSLSEVAELMDVSRNAVHEQVRNVVERLNHYEEILGFHKRKRQIFQLLETLNDRVGDQDEIKKFIKEIKKVVE